MRWLLLLSLALLPPALAQDDVETLRERVLERLGKRYDARAKQVRASLAKTLAQLQGDMAAVRALPDKRRQAVERLLATVAATPDHLLANLVVDTRQARLIPLPVMIDRIADVQLVAIGESHDDAAHHRGQWQVTELLMRRGGGTAVGLEMVTRPYQGHLDRYRANQLSEAQLVEQVWNKTWRSHWPMYAPLLRLGKRGAGVVALNIPRALVRQISRNGLANVPPEIRKQLPAEIDTSKPAHRARFVRMMGGHPGMSEAMVQRFYEAMCAWDEAMAESAARFLAKHTDVARIVVIAGQGHTAPDAIPARALKRGVTSAVSVQPRRIDGSQLSQLRADLLRPPGRYVLLVR